MAKCFIQTVFHSESIWSHYCLEQIKKWSIIRGRLVEAVRVGSAWLVQWQHEIIQVILCFILLLVPQLPQAVQYRLHTGLPWGRGCRVALLDFTVLENRSYTLDRIHTFHSHCVNFFLTYKQSLLFTKHTIRWSVTAWVCVGWCERTHGTCMFHLKRLQIPSTLNLILQYSTFFHLNTWTDIRIKQIHKSYESKNFIDTQTIQKCGPPPLQICIQYLRIKAPTCTQPVLSRPKDPCPVCKVIHPHVNMGRRIKPNTIVYRHSRQC